ncbi:MAG: 2-oxo acid dehydrogenase subunit E2 [Oligoflexia bacterium]|nr:2-oxo acid dehydrogenase subunit E2 [Oligoflexia bacterium]
MATTEFKLPDIGEGVTEGEIVKWLVKEGDAVTHDQPLVEVMTDKATVEIPSVVDGKIQKISAKEGEVIKVGGLLCTIDAQAGGHAAKAAPSGQSAPPPSAPKTQSVMTTSSAEVAVPSRATVVPPPAAAHVLATPATRRFAREAGVDLNNIRGSGPAGRVTREDVSRATTGNGHTVPAGASSAGMAIPAFKPSPKISLPTGQAEERKPLRGIRRKIAENLQRSKQIIPHFTHTDEIDVTDLVVWRTLMKDEAAARGVKLTYLPFIIKAVSVTMREFPQFNASIDDAASEIVYKHHHNIGFAADTPEGLVVPVIKNVESKNVLEVAHELLQLADKARAGKLAPDDMKGGTITVTNIGSIGGISATPIINHPEVAIIGVFKIVKKPVVNEKGEVVVRDMMGLTATCDHRLIDGAAAARFVNKLAPRLSHPQSLLLDLA